MKKVNFLTSIIIISLFLSFTTIGIDSDMVYVSDSTFRENIYKAAIDENNDLNLEAKGLQIVKESITPVYTIDMLEYSKSDSLNIKPLIKNIDGYDRTFYIAKTITESNAFGGNMLFCYKNGEARYMCFYPSEIFSDILPNPRYYSSSSYADHAERIRKILNQELIISPKNVKFVYIDYVGLFFCVDVDGGQNFIHIGYQGVQETYNSYKTDVCLSVSDIKNISVEFSEIYNRRIKEIEAWEKEHPGQTYDLSGGESISPILSTCSQVDNILNISEYLGIDMTAGISDIETDNGQNINSDKLQKALLIIIPVCVFLAGAVTFICIKKRKKA